jgi:hypothetical protein
LLQYLVLLLLATLPEHGTIRLQEGSPPPAELANHAAPEGVPATLDLVEPLLETSRLQAENKVVFHNLRKKQLFFAT